ncbi:hypothetical protein EKO04_011289 [Ascochyta lentis]|uniref:Methyltransferase domain-containing protein n=1 Tax=Ascochyta lentis TaxID=205686 RepID=A0A8H7IW83_9PLEO|nr:hypothetical protein EKO04_011289 [Ascochyta lentis]
MATPPTTTTTTKKSDVDPAVTSAWQSSNVAQRYKAAENATRPFAAIMASQTHVAASTGSKRARVFDLACGTGAVEAEIYSALDRENWSAVEILASDISQPMLGYLAARGEREGWTGLTTRVVDGKELNMSEEEEELFTHVFVGFGIFVLPTDTMRKLALLMHPQGALAVSTWATVPWYELLEETYKRIENGPEVPSQRQLWGVLTDGRAWYDASFVELQLREAGLQRVETVQKMVTVDCGTPDVFMTTMGFVLGMLSKQWSEDVRDKWLNEVEGTMKGILIEEAGGMDKPVFMEFEGIVGVGWKGQ